MQGFSFFDYTPLPFEEIRLLYAFLYLFVFVYFDLKNNKNIPDTIVYALSFLAALFPLLYPTPYNMYAYAQAFLLFALFYVSYILGQIGLAEVFAFSSLALLFPIPPSISHLPINIPFVFFVFIYSGVSFALFALLFFLYKLGTKKPKLNHILLLVGFLVFIALAFSFISLPFLFLLSIVFFSSLYFTINRKEIMAWFVKKVSVDEAEEEVFAEEFAEEKEKALLKDVKVLKKEHLELLKKNKINEVTVYGNMFPFTPFLLLGFVLSLFFSAELILF